MAHKNLCLTKPAIIWVVFVLALAVRMIFVFQWNETPYGAAPLLDAQMYDGWAQAIADGHLLRDRAFYQSPLFPYTLGLIYSIVGHHLLAVGVLNALLGALTALVLSIIAFECFGPMAAWITGALTAICRPMIFYTAPVMKEPLGLLLLALFLLFFLRGLHKNRMKDFVLAGLLLGLSALVRGNVLLLLPVVLLLGSIRWRRLFLKNGFVFVVLTLLAIAPATFHNALVSHDFVPINYADGFNFYIGNSETANGTNAYPPEVSTDPYQEELTVGWVAREQSGQENLKPSGISAYWRNRALDFIVHNPLQDFVLLRNKLAAFWNASEAFDNYDIGFIRKNFDTLLNWPLAGFGLIAPLAALGGVVLWQKRREKVVVFVLSMGAYMASILLFYVTDRYRLPVFVFLLPLAGAALPMVWELIRSKKGRSKNVPWLLGAGGLAMFFLCLALWPLRNIPDLTAFDWGTLTIVYSDMHRDQDVIDSLNKGLAISPTAVGSQAFARASFAEQDLGQEKEAERLLKMATDYYPEDGVILYNYGRLKAARGDLVGALDAMQKALELTPSYILTYMALAKIYDRMGQRDAALVWVKRGLLVDPTDQRLIDTLQQLQTAPAHP